SPAERAAREREALSRLEQTVVAIAAAREHVPAALAARPPHAAPPSSSDAPGRREAELAARLRQAEAAREEAARRLAEAQAAVQRAEERAAIQQQALQREAEERRAALTADLARETSSRTRLE